MQLKNNLLNKISLEELINSYINPAFQKNKTWKEITDIINTASLKLDPTSDLISNSLIRAKLKESEFKIIDNKRIYFIKEKETKIFNKKINNIDLRLIECSADDFVSVGLRVEKSIWSFLTEYSYSIPYKKQDFISQIFLDYIIDNNLAIEKKKIDPKNLILFQNNKFNLPII